MGSLSLLDQSLTTTCNLTMTFQVEVMTSSGRRVRKRNLNECDGNPSGSNRTKKSKGSLKSSKRKSSKSKTLRPQRTAARNARNMFSQIGETSTDGEDDIPEDESSDSLQDSDILSEPEKKMHNKHGEQRKPVLEEFANVAKPPVYSEPQVNVENRRRLVVKFSLRDSKKTVPLEDTSVSCETQSNMVCQSESRRPQESIQNTLPDRSSIDPALSYTDVNSVCLPKSNNRDECSDRTQAETATNHLDTSICVEGNTVQCRQIERETYTLSRSGDALLADTEFDGHLEHNANGYVKPQRNVKKCL